MAQDSGALFVSDFHTLRRNGRTLVWIVPTSGLCSVDEIGRRVLDGLAEQRSRRFDPDLLRRRLDRVALDRLHDTLEELEALGVLSPTEGRIDPTPDAMLPFMEPSIGSLTAFVTSGCNFSCAYCYAQTASGAGAGGHMSFETGRRLLDLLLAGADRRREIRFHFLGGEPLLNMPVITRLIDHGRTHASKLGKRIRFGLTTNGALLTEELVRYFLAHQVGVTVSLDGPQDVHDALRSTARGRGTYSDVLQAVTPLLRARPTRARVTITRRCLDITRIVEHLLRAGFAEVGVSPVQSSEPDLALRDEDHARILDEYRSLADRYLEEARHGRVYGFANLANLLRQIHAGRGQAYPCGAGIQLFAADVDGTLYPCHRFAGLEAYALGDQERGIDRDRQARWLRQARVDSRPDCRCCWARYICGGGCYHLTVTALGNVTRKTASLCPHLREWYELGLTTYAELAETCPEFVERLGHDAVVPRRD